LNGLIKTKQNYDLTIYQWMKSREQQNEEEEEDI